MTTTTRTVMMTAIGSGAGRLMKTLATPLFLVGRYFFLFASMNRIFPSKKNSTCPKVVAAADKHGQRAPFA